ncbi:MAG: phage virion morphogenesis protein [Comamonadaceae bacterium]|nr:phage virion morphogenesis protein [Comamonadaceae bacterium]
MLQISIHIDTSDGLDVLAHRLQHLAPVLHEIGEDVAEATKRRFASATDPDGMP